MRKRYREIYILLSCIDHTIIQNINDKNNLNDYFTKNSRNIAAESLIYLHYIQTKLKDSLKVNFNLVLITNKVIELNNGEEEVECLK